MRGIMFLFFAFCLVSVLLAGNLNASFDDLFSDEAFFRVEEQMVVSASRRAQRLSDAPLLLYVINRDDIRSSGKTSIPELLRSVPGLYVQQITGGQYEVSIRGGINSPTTVGPKGLMSSNILVLINGRSYFNDMVGVTFWETLPINIEDIERIEVVRGGASALFGANAALGVINIITKSPFHSIEEQTVQLTASFGNSASGPFSFLYENVIDNLSFRLSGSSYSKEAGDLYDYDVLQQKYTTAIGDRSDVNYPAPDVDSLDVNKFAVDAMYNFSDHHSIRFEAGLSDGNINFIGHSGDFMITHTPNETYYSKLTYQNEFFEIPFQAMISYINQDFIGSGKGPYDGTQKGVNVNSLDIELQGVTDIGDRNVLVFGLNSRDINCRSDAIFFNIDRENKNQKFNALFINNEFTIIPDSLKFILGARYDKYNTPDIGELSPQAILFYRHQDNHTFRLNYSEAIRIPFLMETFINNRVRRDGIEIINYIGNEDLEAPRSKTLDLSYSTIINDNIYLDITLFSQELENQITFDFDISGYPFSYALHHINSDLIPPEAPASAPAIVLSLMNDNSQNLKTNGLETSLRYPVISGINGFLNATFMNSKLGSQSVKNSPELVISTGFSGRIPSTRWHLNATVNHVSKTELAFTGSFDRNLNISRENPGYFMTDPDLLSNMNTAWEYSGAKNLLFYQTGQLVNIEQALGQPQTIPEPLRADMVELANAIYGTELFKLATTREVYQENASYTTVDLNLSRTFFDGMATLNLNARNLFNKEYKENPFGEVLTGDYRASLTYRF